MRQPAVRGLGLALSLLAVGAPSATAASSVQLTSFADPTSVVVTGDGAGDEVAVQRVAADRVEVTSAGGVTRLESDPTTTTYCANEGPTRVACVVPAGADVSTAGTDLGAGDDRLTLVPASTGPEVRVEALGGAGADQLTGGARDDALIGGTGADVLVGNGGADAFTDDGADGAVDAVSYDDAAHAALGVTVSLDDGLANDGTQGVDGTGPASLDQVGAGIERVVGTDFDDVLVGSPRADQLAGGLGRDTFLAGDGDDRLEARDGGADSRVDCEGGADEAIVDAVDPAPLGCERVDRPAAGGPVPTAGPPATRSSTLVSLRMPDLALRPYADLGLEEVESELSKRIPAVVRGRRLDFADAAAAAGRSTIEPYDLVAQSPRPGAAVSGAVGAPLQTRASFWDPVLDVTRRGCGADPRVRLGRTGTGRRVRLATLLEGASFREATGRAEGAAQQLLRKAGCPYDATVRFTTRAKETTVERARFAVLRRSEADRRGRITTRTERGFRLDVVAPRTENDFLTTFSESLRPLRGELPLRRDGALAPRTRTRLTLNVRERATGRVAEGTRAELVAPGGETIAAGRTDADGMVELVAVPSDGVHELHLSRTRAGVTQEGVLALPTASRAASPWDGISGTSFVLRGGLFVPQAARGAAARAAQAGPLGPAGAMVTLVTQIASAQAAGLAADRVADTAGLTRAQRDQIAGLFLRLAGIPRTSPLAALAGVRDLGLVAGLATTSAGRLCASARLPSITTRTAAAFRGAAAITGKARAAEFGCGRAVAVDPRSGLLVLGAGYAVGSQIISNDGGGLVSDNGGGLISDHGGGIVSNHSTGLIANDGASAVPITPLLANDGTSLLANDGASIVSNHSGAIVANDGTSLQPVGGGTTFLRAGR